AGRNREHGRGPGCRHAEPFTRGLYYRWPGYSPGYPGRPGPSAGVKSGSNAASTDQRTRDSPIKPAFSVNIGNLCARLDRNNYTVVHCEHPEQHRASNSMTDSTKINHNSRTPEFSDS